VLEAGQGVGKDLEKAAEEYLQAGDKVRKRCEKKKKKQRRVPWICVIDDA
jgi:hypothetical protein